MALRVVGSIALWLFFAAGCDRLFKLDEIRGLDGASGPCTPRSIAPGRQHTCAVVPSGAVYCWGNNEDSEVGPFTDNVVLDPTQITLPMPAKQVASGRTFTCARLEDGSVWCWGSDAEGELDGTRSNVQRGPVNVPGIGASAEIAAGAYHACSRDAADGTIWCWGRANNFEAGGDISACTSGYCTVHQIPNTQGSKRLVAGHRHSCMIGADDRAACWGRNNQLQSGGTDPASQPTPVFEDVLGSVIDVSAAGKNTCAVGTDGQTRCWGEGIDGEIANGQFANATMPTITHVGMTRSVSLGSQGGCAVLEDRTVSCWGELDGGRGTHQLTNEPQPSLVQGALSVASHFAHTCAIVDGDVLCWGDNGHGELGRGMRSAATTPVSVTGLTGVSNIAAGFGHVCALASGGVQCWGDNDYGQGGNADLARAYTPAAVSVGGTATKLFAHFARTCAILTNGDATCWGDGVSGSLGNGSSVRHSASPLTVQGTGSVVDIAIGAAFLCVIRGLTVECMGSNDHGQLGSTAANPTLTPSKVTLASSPTTIGAGDAFACARTADANVSCWGTNADGQLGTATGADQYVPAVVPGVASVSELGVGERFACARTGGTVRCWGSNSVGQLGVGDFNSRVGAAQVALGGRSATALWVGPYDACAKVTTGEVYCWGSNTYGELGFDGPSYTSMPTLSPGFNTASDMTLGRIGTCALLPSGLVCSGEARMLASGDPSSSVPTRPNLPACSR